MIILSLQWKYPYLKKKSVILKQGPRILFIVNIHMFVTGFFGDNSV